MSDTDSTEQRPRIFSGIKPSGEMHLGNLLGAVDRWRREQYDKRAVYSIVDLHAMTVPREPGELRERSRDLAVNLLGAGLDPEQCVFFVQSWVPQHTELAWILQNHVSYGELSRMTQFKEKRETAETESRFVSGGLFSYPALMAADILLYDADEVPVGDDQVQHVEITRDIADRFNARFGDTFVIPTATIEQAGARVMDLQAPDRKMSKSERGDAGIVYLHEDPSAIAKKFKRAVTDSETEVRYDPATKPGVSNLLSILGAVTETSPEEAAIGIERYGDLKTATAEAVIERLRPLRARAEELRADPAELDRLMAPGAARASALASAKMTQVWERIGRLDPPTR